MRASNKVIAITVIAEQSCVKLDANFPIKHKYLKFALKELPGVNRVSREKYTIVINHGGLFKGEQIAQDVIDLVEEHLLQDMEVVSDSTAAGVTTRAYGAVSNTEPSQ